MYKVFLVDDEIVIRESMRDNVKWEDINYVFSGEASDGETALPMIQEIRPDVLITDIKMPFMDGLELSRRVRKHMPWIKIVILSGHDEFNYAKEAISIGVTEFLLKPVCANELTEVLNKIAVKIKHERKEKEDSKKLKEHIKSNTLMLRDEFLNELTLGAVSLQDIIDNCERFNIDIVSKYYLVVIIEAEVIDQNKHECKNSEYTKFEKLVDKMVKENNNVIKFKRSIGELVFIIKGNIEEELNSFAYDFSRSIKGKVERNTACELSISIGSVMERLSGITKSFKDADTVNNCKYIYGKNKILGINDIKIKSGIKEFVKLNINNMNEFMKSGSYEDVKQFVNEYVEHLNEFGMNSFIYNYYTFIDIVLNASKFVEELGGDVEKVLPEAIHSQDDLSFINSTDNFKELIENVLKKLLQFRENRVEDRYYNTISKAKDYINSNFQDPKISLNSVATYVNISPSHFCAVFSQEVGETFTEYLTKTRLKKAKELLKTTSQRTSEIAYRIGYNDPHYFSYIFKKWEGITPKEYRNQK